MTMHILAMLEAGVGSQAMLIGGLCLAVLATVLVWLSTHVPENEECGKGTVISRDAPVPLIGLGGSDYGRAVSNSGNTVEVQSPEEMHKPDEEDDSGLGLSLEGTEETSFQQDASHATGSTEQVTSSLDQLLDIQGLDEQTGLSPPPACASFPVPTEKTTGECPAERASPSSTCLHITVRLRFFDDTEELAKLSPHDTIGNLTSKFFSGKEHRTKLIFQGQLLRDPSRSLISLNITHNTVVHCHVSQNPPPPTPPSSEAAGAEGEPRPTGRSLNLLANIRVGSTLAALFDTGLDTTGSRVVPVFAVLLGVVWFFQIQYSSLFTTPATISLLGVTVFFVLVVYNIYED